MLPRLFTGFIVVFWLVMCFLLVKLEVSPDTSDLLTVPPTHVLKLMFTHGQTSELDIFEKGSPSPIGNLVLHPKSGPDSRSLSFSGNFSLHVRDSAKRQRFSWDGVLEMDPKFNTRSLDITVNAHDPGVHVHISLNPATKQAEYEIKQGEETLRRAAVPLDQAGAAAFLRDEFGVDASALQNLPTSLGTPSLTAKQTELKVRKENIAAWLLSIQQGGTSIGEIYVSQLGQILAAKTIFGYSLNAEDTLPPP